MLCGSERKVCLKHPMARIRDDLSKNYSITYFNQSSSTSFETLCIRIVHAERQKHGEMELNKINMILC